MYENRALTIYSVRCTYVRMYHGPGGLITVLKNPLERTERIWNYVSDRLITSPITALD